MKKVILSLLVGISMFAAVKSQAMSYQWATGGACVMYDDQNEYVGATSNEYCERSQGVMYVWDTGGGCAKYTSNGSYIDGVDNQYCRNSLGSSFRKTDEYCGEYTRRGELIRVAEDSECN